MFSLIPSRAFVQSAPGRQVADAFVVRVLGDLNILGSSVGGDDDIPHCRASSSFSRMRVDRTAQDLECNEVIRKQTCKYSEAIRSGYAGSSPQVGAMEALRVPITRGNGSRVSASDCSVPSSHLRLPGFTASNARPRILVVDDEPLYQELIADILGDDYEILFATDGTAALEIAGSKVPDLILLDLMMPGMDGYEVCSRIKADDLTCLIPVIFLTSLGEVVAETKGLKLGAVDYITKPVNPELVRARVSTQIRLKFALDRFALLASTDGLTGLRNRAHFDSMLTYECARHLRSGSELSLIMLDIDLFKAFNDTYGHVRGDDCLRNIALAMTRAISRTTDLVARYGGEEFVMLLPETELKGAVILAGKFRDSSMAWPFSMSTPALDMSLRVWALPALGFIPMV